MHRLYGGYLVIFSDDACIVSTSGNFSDVSVIFKRGIPRLYIPTINGIFIYFLLVEIVAHASKIIVSSINSILLLKVQGPTEFTFITETLSYFLGIGIAAFFMYRICAKKHNLIRLSDLLIFIMCMI